MTLAADAPKESFRLSMLIYDTRFRAYTIQVFVLILVLLAISWLLGNLVTNLAAKGKDINFSFLWNRAGYDIGQHLIPYTNDDTHFRAAIVGLLNTLVVALFACIFATMIGVTAGVLRLSKNWLVSRIVTVYIEVFRNVPLLLWIVLFYVLMSEALPSTADFRASAALVAQGLPATTEMHFSNSVALTNQGMNIPLPTLERGLGSLDLGSFSINLTFLAILAVILGSIFGYRAIMAKAHVVQEATGIRPVVWWKGLLVLFAPISILLWALGLGFSFPELQRFNFTGGILIAHSFTALVLALSVYSATYIAEAVRAGILAISRGQSEAAAALGLRQRRIMGLVILPQALRVIVPPLISQYLNITKNTTLGIAISYLDLKGTLGGITSNQTGRELECMLLMMGTYLVLSLIISSILNVFNNAVKLKER